MSTPHFPTPESKSANQIAEKQVKAMNDGLSNFVTDSMVNQESTERRNKCVEIATSAYRKLQEMRTEFNKLNKPDDIKHVSAGGGNFTPQEFFTQGRVEQLQKMQEKLKNLSDAFDKATLPTGTTSDYDNLAKVLEKTK